MTKPATNVRDLQKKPPTSQELQAMSPKKRVTAMLEASKGIIAQALPKHMNPERLLRVATQAATTTPALLECYTPSLVGAIIQCSTMGLEPNTVLGHAYLVPFKNKKKARTDVQVIIGYKGLIDLARRSGQITSIAAHAVHENDEFDFQYGLEEKLAHKPSMGDRGNIVAFYAVAHMKDGGYAYEVMSVDEVKLIMVGTQSRGAYGPWKDNFSEMGRKTVIRRLSKFLPLSVEFATATALDGMAAADVDQNLDSVLEGDYQVMDNFDSDAGHAGEDVDTNTGEVTQAAAPAASQEEGPPAYADEDMSGMSME